jgi:hypothetical protein
MKSITAGILLALTVTPVLAAETSSFTSTGLGFVDGLHQPEDILQIGDTRWIIVSGMEKGASLSLIDADAKTARPFFTGQSQPDPHMYPDCPAPDPTVFNTQGLALFPERTAGLYRLYAVSHFPFEAIHVFAIDARQAEPVTAWTGCVKLTDGRANAVTAKRDGAILANMSLRGSFTADDYSKRGIKTGGIYAWSPVTKAVRMLPGTEQRGNNGIEISQDETQVYVAVPTDEVVAVYDLADTAKGPRLVATPGWRVDNIHWSGGKLIAAGRVTVGPLCGGMPRKPAAAQGDPSCNWGWRAAALDPVRLDWNVVADGAADPEFGGVTTALIREGAVWLGSYQKDRVAWAPLPGALQAGSR